MIAVSQKHVAREAFFVLIIACGLFGLYIGQLGISLLLLCLVGVQTLIVLPYAADHSTRHTRHVYAYGALYDTIWTGILLGGLAILQYIGFFARHNIHPDTALFGTATQDTALALVYLTITCCITLYIIQYVTKESFIHTRIYREHIWRAAGLSVLCSAFLLYWPFVTLFSHTTSLSLGDWLLALFAAGVFAGIREFQHWDRLHHPRNILALHKRS